MDIRGTNGALMTNNATPSVAFGTVFPSNVPVGWPVTNRFTFYAKTWTSCIATNQWTEPDGVTPTVHFTNRWSHWPGSCVNHLTTSTCAVVFQPRSGGGHAGRLFLVDMFDDPPPGFTFVMNFTGHCSGVVQVMDEQPANAARAVAAGANLQALFSDTINTSTLTSNRFLSWSRQSGVHRGAITWNASTNQATLNPTSDFRPGEVVHAEVARGATNAAASASVRPYAWSFRTAVTNSTIGFLGDSGRRLGTNDARAVALGDLNGDGWLDLFVANWTNGCEVWTNNRAGVLYDSGQRLQTNRNATAVALGDVNNDGRLDAVIVNWMANSRVWTNNGSGVFGQGGTLNGSNPGSAAALGDFDEDGDLDAIVVNDGQTNRLWLNDGSGSYSSTTNVVGIGGARDAAVGDVKGDGTLDVIVVNSNGSSVAWVNDGSGAFASNTTLAAGMSIDVGDVDGDNDLDVALARGSTTRIYLNGGGSFSAVTNLSGGGRVAQLGDLDGDGDLDLARLCNDAPSSVWLNNGGTWAEITNQSFGTWATTQGMDLGDLDNDGDLDAVLALGTNGVRVYWNSRPSMQVYGTNGILLVNNETSAPAKGTDFGVLTGGSATNTFVITNASPVNLIVTSISTNGSMASQFRLLDTPTVVPAWSSFAFRVVFEPVGSGLQWTQLAFGGSWTGTPFQINLQGTYAPPLVVTNATPHNGSNPVDRASTISAQFSEPVDPVTVDANTFRLWSRTRGPLAGTVTVDGSALGATFTPATPFLPGETIFAELTDSVLSSNGLVHLYPEVWSFIAQATNGTGVFYVRQLDAAGPNEYPSDAVLGDLDGDGDLDGIVALQFAPVTQSVAQIFLNDGAGGLTNSHGLMIPHKSSDCGARGLALGDLDGDGDLDIVLGFHDTAYSSCTLLWNDGHAGFTIDTNSIAAEGGFLSVGDLDGDGDLDLFLKDADEYSGTGVAPWFNDGSGHFARGVRIEGIQDQSGSRLTDIDGDGDLDAIVSDLDNVGLVYAHVTVLINNGHGAFTVGQVLDMGFSSYAVEPGDVDGDGDPDLVARDWLTQCWLNDGAGHFIESSTFPSFESDHTAMGVGDFDADRDLDVLLPTQSTNAPSLMRNDGYGTFATGVIVCKSTGMYCAAVGDLDGNGSLDVFCASGYGRNHHVLLNLSPERQIPLIDLALSMTLDQATTNMGDTILFTMFLTNSGPDAATGIAVENFPTVTNRLSYLGGSGAYDTNRAIWSVSGLGAGCATSIQVTAMTLWTGTLVNVAQVRAANEYDTDSTPSNYPTAEDDSAIVTNKVTAEACDLDLYMTANNPRPAVGSNVVFTLTITNRGPSSDARNMVVTDLLPSGVDYVSHVNSYGTYNPVTGIWSNNSGTMGNHYVLIITSRVAVAGTFTNVLQLQSTGVRDPFSWNNRAAVIISTRPMIWASAGPHGGINPSGAVGLVSGASQDFVVTADPYYWVDGLLTNGAEDSAARHAKIFTSRWTAVTADGTVSVSFAEALAAHGTPEWWLAQYGWTNDFDAAEMNDTDGDSFFAWQEQIAGTDPTVSTSFFQCLEISSTNFPMLGKVIRWAAASGRVYSIDGSTNLPAGWFGLASNLPSSGMWTDLTHATEGIIQYRLGVQKP